MAVNLAQGCIPAAAQDAAALRAVFESIGPESCPHSFNFHIHTLHSDGRLHPDQVMEQAIALGLQGLAITDHHSVNGYHRAQEWLEDWHWSHPNAALNRTIPRLWIGMEVNASLLETEVHILCYAFNPSHPALFPYLQSEAAQGDAYSATRVIAAVHEAGGIAVLAHPARYRRSPADLIPAAAHLGIDGIETYYAYNNPSPWQPSPRETQVVHTLGQTHQLLQTCGTDSHGMSLLQRL